MIYQVSVPGCEGRNIELRTGYFSSPKLLVDGQPAPKGPHRGELLLRRSDGTDVVVSWKRMFLGLDVPQLLVGGQAVKVVEPLAWYEMVWCGLPVVLVFAGGALGGLIGAVAVSINAKIFREQPSLVPKFAFTGMLSVAAGTLYFSIALAILRLAQR